MRKLHAVVITAVMFGIGCGGAVEEELGSTKQAISGGSSAHDYILALVESTTGVVGTGLVVGRAKVLVQWFHRGWPHNSSNYLHAYSKQLGAYRTVYMDQCTVLFGAWAICNSADFGSSHAKWTNWSYWYPESNYVEANGAGNICNSDTMSTYYPDWDFSWSTTTKRKYIGAILDVGQASLCGPLSAYCYEYYAYNGTCMWGDDGSMQFKYGTAGLVGMGFGNAGAAWANQYVLSWLDDNT